MLDPMFKRDIDKEIHIQKRDPHSESRKEKMKTQKDEHSTSGLSSNIFKI